MPQHEECNLFLEDFEKSERSQRCDGCFALDGRTCLGVSHKRKDTGKLIIPSHLSIQHRCCDLILSLGSPLTSPSRSRLSVLKLKLVEDKVSYNVVMLCDVVVGDCI